MNFITFILRRAARHWQILLTLTLGVMLSTALLASSPVLVNTVVEFGLRRNLLAGAPLESNLRFRAYSRLDQAAYEAYDAQTRKVVANHIGPYVQQIVPTAGARWLFPWLGDQATTDQRVSMRFYGLGESDIAQYVTFLDGGWPETPFVEDGVVAVVIGAEMAQTYDLQVGSRLPLSIKQSAGTPDLTLEVSGIVQPENGRSPYWFGEYSPLRSSSDERWSAQYIALLPYSDFFPVVERYFTGDNLELYWQVLSEADAIGSQDISLLRVELSRLRSDLRELQPAITVDSQLDDVLANFASQSTAVRAPLYFLSAEVVLLILYYVIMVAALAVRQVEREFAILQSRGAAGTQIFRIQAGEALLISAVAFFSGPLLGMLLVRALVIAGPLADVSEPGWTLTLPQSAWLTSSVGVLAALAGLLIPVGPAIKRSIVTYQQTSIRDTRAPFWQRYYLDVFALALGLVLLLRLQFYGGIVGGGTTRPQVDWLLLLSPIALLVGSGTILLRIFPLILRLASALTSRGRGLPAALAMWQAARNPAHVARLVLLLTLAMSLGILSTGINATLDTSEQERAQYAAGSDVRLISKRGLPVSEISMLPDVATWTSLWRSQGSVRAGRSYMRFDVLAIEPYAFAPLTLYRSDFSVKPMGQLLGDLVVDNAAAQPTIPLPGKPGRFGVWVFTASDEQNPFNFGDLAGDSDLDRIGLEAKLRTAHNELLTIELLPQETGGFPEGGWRYFSGEVPLLSEDSYPLGAHSLWVRNRSRTIGVFSRSVGRTLTLAIDEMTVVDAVTGETAVASDMEELTQIWFLDNRDSQVSFNFMQKHSGLASQGLHLNLAPIEQVGMKLVPKEIKQEVLPLLVSNSFLTALEAQVGDEINIVIESQPVPAKIMGVVNYFPTMYEDLDAGYVITNRDSVLNFLNSFSDKVVNVNEALVEVTDGASSVEVSAAAETAVPLISQALELETIRKTIKADPMALGLRSVTFFGYVLTTALSLVGFATYFYMSARQKEALYGVLRSIGMSPRQLYGTLVLEQVILILAGLAVGTVLGVVLNLITLPGLPITFGDRPPTPPFIAQNDWLAVGRIYLTLTVAFFITLGLATMLLWRTKLHRVLRVGEE